MIQSDFVQKTNSASSDSTSSAVYFTEEFSASQLFFVEELNDDLVKKFNQLHLQPYFKGIFADLVLRSSSPTKDQKSPSIDKVTLIEFNCLPGILSDRFYALLGGGPKSDQRVTQERFLTVMTQVYSSSLEEKMSLAFNIFDFDSDGKITSDDVRIILNYIPLRQESSSSLSLDDSTIDFSSEDTFSQQKLVKLKPSQEGLYNKCDGKDMNEDERGYNQKQITNFVNQVFQSKESLNLKEFIEFNSTVSSEMFISVISIIHERLPCSQFVFRQKKAFKLSEFQKNQKMLTNGVQNIDADALVAKAEEMCMSPLKALPNPKMLQGWKPKKLISDFKSEQSLPSASSSTKKSSLGSVDFKIKKKVGVFNDSTRQQALQNSRMSQYSSELADSDIELERHDSISRLIDNNKMRRLQDAKRIWQKNHASSPFRMTFSNDFSGERCGDQGFLNQLGGTSVIKMQNCKGIEGDSPTMRDKSTFSKFNKTQETTFAKKGNPPQSSFKRAQLPKIQTGSQVSFSPSHRPSKKNFDTTQILEEPNSPLVIMNQSNQAAIQEIIVDNFCSGKSKFDLKLEGKCLLKTRTDRFKEHWAVVLGKDLLCYRQQGDTEHRVMHCLAGTFIQESSPEVNPETGQYLYPVKVVLPPNKSRILYFTNQDLQSRWINSIRKVVGEQNVNDFYDISTNLGKGQFGVVKLAKHKKNQKQVAIKVITKANMKPIEIFQQRREIEVLKMCQHQSIIKLVDLFENSDNYFIVLEYMAGKDLFDYIAKRDYMLHEERAKIIIYQIMQGVKYLHGLGIVHRDLKLENIMMNDAGDKALPKIVDFGLSKIIGPNETATEPFGTLGYVAPEVLKKQPYTFSCDVWSLGCILYALLSGSLPFDHNEQKELMRMTMEDTLKFDLPVWDKVSSSCKSLIADLLKKSPSQRITLGEAMRHPCFDSIRHKFSSEQLQN